MDGACRTSASGACSLLIVGWTDCLGEQTCCGAQLRCHAKWVDTLGPSPANWSHSPEKIIRQVITECRRSRSVESPPGISHSVTSRPGMETSVHRRTPVIGSHLPRANHVLKRTACHKAHSSQCISHDKIPKNQGDYKKMAYFSKPSQAKPSQAKPSQAKPSQAKH